MSEPNTISLQYPIKMGDETLREVTLRRAQVKDLREVDKVQGEVAKVALLIGQLTGLAPPVVDQLDLADFKVLGDQVAGFLSQVQVIGVT